MLCVTFSRDGNAITGAGNGLIYKFVLADAQGSTLQSLTFYQ